jgi:integrase/recombinase XerD
MTTDTIRGVLVQMGPRSTADRAAAAFLARYANEHTRRSYELAIRQWYEFCRAYGLDPLTAERAHIEVWCRLLENDAGNKAATVASKLNALAGLYKYAHLDGLIPQNPMAYVNRPKVPYETTTNALSRTEFADILKAAEVCGRPQWHALVCLLGLNGFRVGEALQVDIDRIGHDKGYTVVTVRRKGGKIDTQPLSNVTAWAVDRACEGRAAGPLFTKRNGNRMDRRDAGRIVEKLADRVGITKRITPHSFRHTHVTLGLDSGVASRDIMASTGHRDTMVHYYDHRAANYARAATHAITAYVSGAA